MSTGVEWLQKQRKADLGEIADHVGLKSYDKLKKNELEAALEQFLRSNSSRYQSDPTTAPFYQGSETTSPTKAAKSAKSGGSDEKKPRQRRQTLKTRDDLAGDSDLARTPARALALAKRVPLPPSPAVLANQIDIRTTKARASLARTIRRSQLPGYATYTRRQLSNVTSIELLVLFIEAWGLRAQVLPLRYLSTIPAIPAIGLADPIAVQAPDLFALLTLAFWGPVGLWLTTSVFLPLLGGWFINLRAPKGEEGFDPVSFNAVKALAAWIFFLRKGVTGDSVRAVERGVPGGSTGLLIGAAIGGIAGLYESVLLHRRK